MAFQLHQLIIDSTYGERTEKIGKNSVTWDEWRPIQMAHQPLAVEHCQFVLDVAFCAVDEEVCSLLEVIWMKWANVRWHYRRTCVAREGTDQNQLRLTAVVACSGFLSRPVSDWLRRRTTGRRTAGRPIRWDSGRLRPTTESWPDGSGIRDPPKRRPSGASRKVYGTEGRNTPPLWSANHFKVKRWIKTHIRYT